MAKIFEDEFMDFQANIISSCLDLSQEKVDKIYAYAFIEESTKAFNVFFEVDGKIKSLNEVGSALGLNIKQLMSFINENSKKLRKLEKLCNKYKMTVPKEMKMVYEVNTGKYGADYSYEPVCASDDEPAFVTGFKQWLAQENDILN